MLSTKTSRIPMPLRQGRRRYIINAVVVVGLIYWIGGALRRPGPHSFPIASSWTSKAPESLSQPLDHPIDKLINNADIQYNELMSRETEDVREAAAAYRKRRGRHPPPGFDVWFGYAKTRQAVIVEDFWDQIYDDLKPFWAVPPKKLRAQARHSPMKISLKDQKATADNGWFWTELWLDLVKTLEGFLPDMDLPLNAMDEPRIVAHWEVVNAMVQEEQKSRKMPPPADVIQAFTIHGDDVNDRSLVDDVKWSDTMPYWSTAARGCPPTSPARQSPIQNDFSHRPDITNNFTRLHTYQGYISNFTKSSDICHQPDLQGMHGIFVRPTSIQHTDSLIPMFGGSKLHTNNEILLPPAMYWSKNHLFTAESDNETPWANKKDRVIWRGTASGGISSEENWKAFQRHRFVAMVNSTQVHAVEAEKEEPVNWAMPSENYNLAAIRDSHFGDWVNSWSDVAFIELLCSDTLPNGLCAYNHQYFHTEPTMIMAAQFANKYVPDVDGNSFSGRYRAFLMSGSLPIKATLFREWHDSRLIPWKHFVPMDNRFQDFYGIMEYFVGYQGYDENGNSLKYNGGEKGVKTVGHDAEAEKIASEGRDWAKKVLREEDMQIYVLRLLLEYARVLDERRDDIGWVEDLKSPM